MTAPISSIARRAILPMALLLSGTSAFAQSGPWTVSEARGEVVIRTADGDRAASRGATIDAGQQVVTGGNGNATIVRGREFVTVRPKTRITIAPRERERGVIQIIQDFGSALFNIGRQPDPHFGVDTPYLAAVVKGTTFTITVSEEGSSMQVTEGAVEASTSDGGARDLVRPGEVAIIAAQDMYRLNIVGDVSRQIDSPQRGVTPSVSVTPTAVGGASTLISNAVVVQASGNSASASNGSNGQGQVISVAVGSSSRNLDELSGGLVSGEVAATADRLVVNAVESEARNNDSNGNGSRGSDSNGSSGSGSGNGANGAGSDAGNSGDNGNGAGAGDPGGNGNGGGAGNSGDNGSGNAGDQGNGSGNSGDNGVGNAGGQGDGADNSGDQSGSAGGNGNGTGNAGGQGEEAGNSGGQGGGAGDNGNGAGDPGDQGNGSESGNSGGEGDGAGNSDDQGGNSGSSDGNGAADGGRGSEDYDGSDEDGDDCTVDVVGVCISIGADSDDSDDGNNGHGNDDDGFDDSNPGNAGAGNNGQGQGGGRADDEPMGGSDEGDQPGHGNEGGNGDRGSSGNDNGNGGNGGGGGRGLPGGLLPNE